jgi:transposase
VTKLEHLIVGVDTHSSTHHAVIISNVGAVIGSEEFRADPSGYQSLFAWITKHGTIDRVGVEGTNAYGAGLARHLAGKGIAVVEVPRPDRRTRRSKGKSDPIDAGSPLGPCSLEQRQPQRNLETGASIITRASHRTQRRGQSRNRSYQSTPCSYRHRAGATPRTTAPLHTS